MSNRSLKSSQILRAHMTYFCRPSHKYDSVNDNNLAWLKFGKFGEFVKIVKLGFATFVSHVSDLTAG